MEELLDQRSVALVKVAADESEGQVDVFALCVLIGIGFRPR